MVHACRYRSPGTCTAASSACSASFSTLTFSSSVFSVSTSPAFDAFKYCLMKLGSSKRRGAFSSARGRYCWQAGRRGSVLQGVCGFFGSFIKSYQDCTAHKCALVCERHGLSQRNASSSRKQNCVPLVRASMTPALSRYLRNSSFLLSEFE